mgnify:FL=1
MREYETLRHVFEPVYDGDSRVLILGTFPSVRSRETGFYYGHPRNRFWKVLESVCTDDEELRSALLDDKTESSLRTVEEKKRFLLENRIAIWDVIAQCDIAGSSDSSIRSVVPTDLNRILDHAQIRAVCANGAKARELYMKYSYEITKREIIKLPSTSPANAAFRMQKLTEHWSMIREYL